MAAYYYVKSGGTATGDGGRTTSMRTGTWSATASEYYDNISDATGATTAPTAGDFIIVSAAHIHDYNATTTLTIPDGVKIICVFNSNQDTVSSGALEKTDLSGSILYLKGSADGDMVYSNGVDFTANNQIGLVYNDHGHGYYRNCTIKTDTNVADDWVQLNYSQYGVYTILENVTLTFLSSHLGLRLGYGSHGLIKSCTVTSGSSFLDSGGLGGLSATAIGCNLSAMDSGTTLLHAGGDDTGDTSHLEMIRCKLPATYNILESSLISHATRGHLRGCDAGDGYHFFHYEDICGEVLESTTVYRTGGATYDGTNGFSVEYQPGSNVKAFIEPLSYKLGEYEIDLSTDQATFTFHFVLQDTVAPTGLTDHECWIEIIYPDATDNALGKQKLSRSSDELDTPTTLTTSTESWTGTTGNTTKQKVSATIPAATGMTKAPITVYLHVAKDLVTGSDEMFVCPSPDITFG